MEVTTKLFLAVFCIIGQASIINSTPSHSIPAEFFTCDDRQPGLYADVKRSCAFYYECADDAAMNHHRCEYPTLVFDDQSKSCVVPELGAGQDCPAGTDHFTSASVFCRGRPGPDNNMQQDFYPDESQSCEGYFWCYKVGEASFGVRQRCNTGTRFDRKLKRCVHANLVPCGQQDLYPYNVASSSTTTPP